MRQIELGYQLVTQRTAAGAHPALLRNAMMDVLHAAQLGQPLIVW